MARQFRDQLEAETENLKVDINLTPPPATPPRPPHRRPLHCRRLHAGGGAAPTIRPLCVTTRPIPRHMTGESEPLLEGTLISHLLELRTRLMRAFIAVILVFPSRSIRINCLNGCTHCRNCPPTAC
jgi:hypothetical protein